MEFEDWTGLEPITVNEFRSFLISNGCEIVEGSNQDRTYAIKHDSAAGKELGRVRMQDLGSQHMSWHVVRSYCARLKVDPSQLLKAYKLKKD